MAAITSDTTDRVAAIIGDTLNGWFQPHLHFDPIVVRQRYDDWYDEDYLEAWIVWEGTTITWTTPASTDYPSTLSPS